MKEQSSCGLQIVATDKNQKAVVICTEVLKIMAKPSDFRPEEQISFQITDIHMSMHTYLGCQGHQLSHQMVLWAHPAWSLGHSLGVMSLPISLSVATPLGCPRSFHHLVRPILTSCVSPFGFWRLKPLFCILRHPRKSARHRITTQSTLVGCTINLHLDVSSP